MATEPAVGPPQASDYYIFYSNNDLRSGPLFRAERASDLDEDADDELLYVDEFEFEPKPDFTVLLYEGGTVLEIAEVETLEAARSVCLEVHTAANGFGPFAVTGYTSSYREEGDYAPAVEITTPGIEDLTFTGNPPAGCIVIDHEGDVVHELCVLPPS